MDKDLERLMVVKEGVLSELEGMFPKTVEKARSNNSLCFYIQDEEGFKPIIDFNQDMPKTMLEYKAIINKSATELMLYSNVLAGCLYKNG